MRIYGFMFELILMVICSVTCEPNIYLRNNLTEELLSNYNQILMPVLPVDISLFFGFYQLVTIDERNQIMTINGYLLQEWTDYRLKWDPNVYGSIKNIILPSTMIWLPDTHLRNSGSSKVLFASDINANLNAKIDFDGNILLYLPMMALETRCQVNTRKFPFDIQVCPIIIESWSMDLSFINYNRTYPIFFQDAFIENTIWKFKDVSIELEITPYNYSRVYYLFEFERKPLYYMVNGIFPCFILNIVSIIAFIMDYEMQVNLSLTCFLTLTVNSVVVLEDIPVQSDYLPLITLYFMVSIMLPFISLFWFMYYESLSKKKKIPKWIEIVYLIKIQVLKTFKSCKRKLNYPLDSYTSNDQQEEILLKKQLNLINNLACFLFFVCVLVCDLTIWLSFMD